MIVRDLGLVGYEAAMELQEARLGEVAAGAEDTLLLLEHPPVVTLGRHGGRENLVAGTLDGVAVVQTARGGNATCHFPGQLVGYAIFRLSRHGGVRGLVAWLEKLLLAVLAEFGVTGQQDPARPGVWVAGRKIASLGLGIRRLTSFHGFSLNVGPDLELFSSIVPCGLAGVEVTSLSLELGRTVAVQEVKDVVVRLSAAAALAAAEAAPRR